MAEQAESLVLFQSTVLPLEILLISIRLVNYPQVFLRRALAVLAVTVDLLLLEEPL